MRQIRLAKQEQNEQQPRGPQYPNRRGRPNKSVRPSFEKGPPSPNPSAATNHPIFPKGFLFSNSPPFSTQLQVRERAFLPYQPDTQRQETSTGKSAKTRQPGLPQQPPWPNTASSIGNPPISERPASTQRPRFKDITHSKKFIPIPCLAMPHPLRPVRTTELSPMKSEIAAFREAMLRVLWNEQERREQDALMEAELDKAE